MSELSGVSKTTFFNGSMSYTLALTVGVFTALSGSALLESSYFVYRKRVAEPRAAYDQ